MVWGMLIGMAAGVVIGSTTGRIGFWLPICLMVGMLCGVLAKSGRRS